jgi:fatty acid desaturase
MSASVAQPGTPFTRAEVLARVKRTPDLAYGLYHLCAAYGQLALLLALVPLRPAGALPALALIAAMGLTQYRLYFPLHEACHGSLFASPLANRLVGRLTAALFFTSLDGFTAIHMQHHRLYGEAEDPGAPDYYVRFRSRAEAWRFFLAPLVGLTLLDKIQATLGQPLLRRLGRADAAPRQPVPAMTRSPLDLAWVAGVQALVCLAITGLGARPLDYVLFYVLPGSTVFLFLARLRMYLEHGPVDYAVSDYLGPNRRRIARTHPGGALLRPLFSYMNFQYHWEHHLFPSLPSSRLPEVYERYTAAALAPDDLGASYAATVGRLWHLADGGDAGRLPARPGAPPTAGGAAAGDAVG